MPSPRRRLIGLLVALSSIAAVAGAVAPEAGAVDPVTSFVVPNSVDHLVESADGSAIALSTVDGHVQVRDTATYALINTLDLHASDLLTSAATGWFYAMTDDEIEAIDPATGTIVHSYGELGGQLGAAAMNAAGTALYFVDDAYGSVYALNTATGAAFAQSLRFSHRHVDSLAERDGLLYAALDVSDPERGSTRQVCRFDPSASYDPDAPCTDSISNIDLEFALTADGGVVVGALNNAIAVYDSSLSLVTAGQFDDLTHLRGSADGVRTYVSGTDAPIIWFTGDFTAFGTIGSGLNGLRNFWVGASNAYLLTFADTSGVGRAVQKSSGTYTVNIVPTTSVTTPAAPTDVTATLHGSAMRVAFTAPTDDGGTAIDSYTVTASDRTDPTAADITADGTTSPIDVTGLVAGHSYDFTVVATNSAGGGTASDPATATYLAPQQIAFTATDARALVGVTYPVGTTAGGSGSPVRFVIGKATTNGACTISSSDGSTAQLVLAHVGTCQLLARQAGSAQFAKAAQVQKSFKVAPGAQNVAFDSLPTTAYVGTTTSVSATGTGTGTVSITVAGATTHGACSLDGTTLHFDAVGRCALIAVQQGNADYRAATSTRSNIDVRK